MQSHLPVSRGKAFGFCFAALIVAAAAGANISGCSPKFYRDQADRDSYRIIQAKQRQVLGEGEPPSFSVDPMQSFQAELDKRGYDANLSADAMRQDGVAPGPTSRPDDSQARLTELLSGPPRPPTVAAVGVVIDGPPAPTTAPATTQAAALASQADESSWLVEPVDIPPVAGAGDLFIEPGRWPANVRRIDLVTALQAAAINSRSFQSNKEAVYTAALALTSTQHVFENQFFGTMAPTLAQNGSPDNRSGTVDSALGVNRTFTTGGTMALSVTNTLMEVFTDPTGKTAQSAINLALSQPLLRGAGYRVAAEPLIQADRNVIYAVRTFERFKRQLAVSIATGFYQVLQQGDEVINEQNNYANLIRARQRTEKLAEAGRLPEFQVDQARQDELRARNRWVIAIQGYNQGVDQFRRTLGVPTDWPIVPDPDSLTWLTQRGLKFDPPGTDEAVKVALANRLDLKTVRDKTEDAARRVYVAADAFQAGLSVAVAANVPSGSPQNRPTDFRFERGQYSVGASLSLPLDRLDERNAYRQTLLALHQAQRDLTDQVDQVSQDVRESIRNVIRARNTYEIQAPALRLAARRVESTGMLLQAGRASTRDLLDAQDALVEAQNALTGALVDYHIARLQLLRSMETLQVERAGLTYHDPTTDR